MFRRPEGQGDEIAGDGVGEKGVGEGVVVQEGDVGDGETAVEEAERRLIETCTAIRQKGVPSKHPAGVYYPAVRTLQELTHQKSGLRKAFCFKQTVGAIMRIVQAQNFGEPLGADDLLPLLCYVTLQARPACLETELRIMEVHQTSLRVSDQFSP